MNILLRIGYQMDGILGICSIDLYSILWLTPEWDCEIDICMPGFYLRQQIQNAFFQSECNLRTVLYATLRIVIYIQEVHILFDVLSSPYSLQTSQRTLQWRTWAV